MRSPTWAKAGVASGFSFWLSVSVEEALHYFVSNVSRLQYGTFRAAGYFINPALDKGGDVAFAGAIFHHFNTGSPMTRSK